MGYLTKTDKLMLKYLEKWGGFTITQAALMFFPKNNNNYSYARRRLHILHERKVLKRFTSETTDEYIYYEYDNKKPPRDHEVFAMTLYAWLQYYGLESTYYVRNKGFMNDKIFCDFLTVFKVGEKKKALWGEVNLNHERKIEDLEKFCETGELQEKLEGDFPLVVVMSNKHKIYESDMLNIFNMDLRLTGFLEKIINL